MWKLDGRGNATNGVDKAILIQVELCERFDVFLPEKIDKSVTVTPLRRYMLKNEAFIKIAKLNTENDN